MTIYRGERTLSGCTVKFRDGSVDRQLPLRLDLANHSPTGFEWGYGGSGPAQLALALLAHHTGDGERALRHYQALKDAMVSRWITHRWELTSDALAAWLEGR